MTTVLKLGGSVITHKDETESVDDDTLDQLAATLGDAVERGAVSRLVVVHGAGSFGHYYADKHEVSESQGTHEAAAIAEIHGAMTALTQVVVERLQNCGLDAVPVRPLSVAYRNPDFHLPTGSVETLLEEGFVPVLHGDVIGHAGKGATILSGDDIVVSLARTLDVDRLGLCSTVPGVLDDDGDVIDHIDSFDDVADYLGASESTDVTGGMAGKVRTLLALSTPAHVFGPAGLADFLDGDAPGTVVSGAEF